jgi:hypothetical protein
MSEGPTPELFGAHIAVNLEAPFFLMQAVVAGSVIDWGQNVLGGMD